jgi:hypothetical protein
MPLLPAAADGGLSCRASGLPLRLLLALLLLLLLPSCIDGCPGAADPPRLCNVYRCMWRLAHHSAAAEKAGPGPSKPCSELCSGADSCGDCCSDCCRGDCCCRTREGAWRSRASARSRSASWPGA